MGCGCVTGYTCGLCRGSGRENYVTRIKIQEIRMKKPFEIEIGTVVCDMHYGLPSRIGFDWEGKPKIACSNWIQTPCKDSNSVLEKLLESAGVTLLPTNKEAVVVSENLDGSFTAAYSYDGMKFGMFTFTVK